MEPDVKTLLTQKIREVEREPIAWNKAAVWMKVQDRVSPKSSRPVYYYAAAGVTFLLFGALFLWQQNQVMPVEKVTAVKEPTETPAVQHHIAVESKMKESSAVNNTPFMKHTPSEKTYVVNVEDLPVLLSTQEEEVTVLEEVVEEPVVTSIATSEERVQPIVGVVIGAEQKQAVSTKTKRKKLRMLDPIEKPGTPPTDNLILARIK